jgi:hypothetical protein
MQESLNKCGFDHDHCPKLRYIKKLAKTEEDSSFAEKEILVFSELTDKDTQVNQIRLKKGKLIKICIL